MACFWSIWKRLLVGNLQHFFHFKVIILIIFGKKNIFIINVNYLASGSSWRSLIYEYILQNEEDDLTTNTIVDINNSMGIDIENSTEINEQNINKNNINNTNVDLVSKIFAHGFTQNTHSSTIQIETNIPSGNNYYIAKVRVCTTNNNKICSG